MIIKKFQSNMLTKRDLLLFDESICKNDYILFKPYPRQSWPIFQVNKPLVDNEANTALIGVFSCSNLIKASYSPILFCALLTLFIESALIDSNPIKRLLQPDIRHLIYEVWMMITSW